jgi:hypothetical protein
MLHLGDNRTNAQHIDDIRKKHRENLTKHFSVHARLNNH